MSTRRSTPLGPAEYARQVRLALADLAPGVLIELLEDLDEHLADVATDTAEPLETRLGPPALYARELRLAAGLAPPAAAGTAQHLQALRVTAERLVGHDTVRSVLAFLPELRPAWWVLRGWLAVVALGYLSGYHSLLVPFGVLLGPPLIGVAVVGSVRLGRRSVLRPVRDRRQQLVTAAANAGLAVVALVALVAVQQQPAPVYAGGDPASYGPGFGGSGAPRVALARSDGSPITNIYPYSASGQPLTGVLLYDQDGRALDNLALMTRDGVPLERVLPTGPPLPANAYPQQQRPTAGDATSTDPTFAPIPVPDASPSATQQAPSPGVPGPPTAPGLTGAVPPGPSSTGLPDAPSPARPGVPSATLPTAAPTASTLPPGR